MDIDTVVLVGHCGFDANQLARFVEQTLPDVKVVSAHEDAALASASNEQSLWLVNRKLDGRFDTDGLGLITRQAAKQRGPRVMLISNYADAQQQAQNAGAFPGFGKADLFSDHATTNLKAAAP